MGRMVTVSKAAGLLGLDRHALQKMIREGELHTFEGKLDLEELRECYPGLARDDTSAILERITLIKRSAFSRRVGATLLPDTDTLEAQLRRRNTDLGVQKARADKYQGIVDDLLQELADLRHDAGPEQRELIHHLGQWLLTRVNRDGRHS